MQKRKEKLNLKQQTKGKLLLLTGISLFTILGGTLAYFTTSDTINNVFNTSKYGTQIVEEFESPNEWTPGTTIDKEVNIKNTGSINIAVRAKFEERWVNANGSEISLVDSNGNIASIIHFNDGWTKDNDGYYYYGTKDNLTKLQPNSTSNSFISGVTFNSNIEASLNKTVSSDGQTITYESSGIGYDGAKYYLTIKIDTVQYDYAQYVW